MNEEKTRSEVIICKVEEKGRDGDFIKDLCKQIGNKTVPTGILRLGEKSDSGRPRLMKATFPSQFDARTFRSRYQQKKKESDDIPDIHIRPNRNGEERKKFASKKSIADKLNEEVKKNKAPFSFSIRDNCEIWKYEKQEDGKWRRVKDWKLSDEDPTQVSDEDTKKLSDEESKRPSDEDQGN